MEQRLRNKTLKGSLSVLKLMPGTYLSQTGNPLNITPKKKKIKKIKKKNPESEKPSRTCKAWETDLDLKEKKIGWYPKFHSAQT